MAFHYNYHTQRYESDMTMYNRTGRYAPGSIQHRYTPAYRGKRVKTTLGVRYGGNKRPRIYGFLGRNGGRGSETKFVDSEVTPSSITTSWIVLNPTTKDCLTAVAQGTTESEHLGRTMYITSIHIKGLFIRSVLESSTIPVGAYQCRFVIVLDHDTKGAEVTPSDVMDIGQSNDILAFRNLQHTSRLMVLKDKQFVINPTASNEGAVNLFATGEVRRVFKFNYTFKQPIRVLFSGTTAVVGSIVDNSIHFLVVCSENGAGTCEYQCRVRFKDTLP